MTRSKLMCLVLLAALACSVVVAGCKGKGPSASSGKPKTTGEQAPATTSAAERPKPGVAGAVVKIEAYYPFNPGHQFIVDYLNTLDEKYPGKVSVQVWDQQTPEGRKKWSTTNLGCAGVFVNGITQHEITRNGKTETVNFVKRMGTFWMKEDLEAVIEQIIAKAEKGK